MGRSGIDRWASGVERPVEGGGSGAKRYSTQGEQT